ncbi:P2-like prophage tail protein X [Devosia pacifica]|uniref:P2-like prophage tail protein X n=1 Tax=Devosia pacifica TaxID=1335967 RepID=A0A918RY70_9HYPH|nr:tail protein X [Devosia pacifica]GHA13234.1 P2-like prophage tail protein X [Devosia pacifica]
METVTITRERMTLDLLLWRRFGGAGRALIAAALTLNPGLAALGPVLPLGTVVTLPEPPLETAQRSRKVLSLFGDA